MLSFFAVKARSESISLIIWIANNNLVDSYYLIFFVFKLNITIFAK